MKRLSRKTILIFIAIFSLVAVAGWLAYDWSFLRITHTTPSGNIPTSTPYIALSFNDEISSADSATFDAKNAEFTVSGNTITITRPDGVLENDRRYTIEIKGIKTKRKQTSGTIQFSFTARYVAFDKQPEDIQKASIQKSDSGQVSDPFFLLPSPIGTTEGLPFFITTNTGQHVDKPYVEITFLAEVRDFSTGQKPQVSDQRAEELYTQSLDYIRSLDGTPEKYTLHFSNEYLNQKYGDSN